MSTDYYEILGVARDATDEELQQAFRETARKLHPDVNGASDAEAQFKALNRAYAVLKDRDSRLRYDRFGAGGEQGEQGDHGAWTDAGGIRFHGGDGVAFEDLYRDLFAGVGGNGTFRRGFEAKPQRGRDLEVKVWLSVAELIHPGSKVVKVQRQEVAETGEVQAGTQTLDVRVPLGVTEGSRIRLAGQGGKGLHGGPAGDLFLRVAVLPHLRYGLSGHDLHQSLAVTAWEAALGARVSLRSPWGRVQLVVPAGSQSGDVLRLRGQGLPVGEGRRGDLLVRLGIEVPKTLSAAERDLFEKLAAESSFRPEGREDR